MSEVCRLVLYCCRLIWHQELCALEKTVMISGDAENSCALVNSPEPFSSLWQKHNHYHSDNVIMCLCHNHGIGKLSCRCLTQTTATPTTCYFIQFVYYPQHQSIAPSTTLSTFHLQTPKCFLAEQWLQKIRFSLNDFLGQFLLVPLKMQNKLSGNRQNERSFCHLSDTDPPVPEQALGEKYLFVFEMDHSNKLPKSPMFSCNLQQYHCCDSSFLLSRQEWRVLLSWPQW